MPVPTPIDLNDLVPAAPLGLPNVKWQTDNGNPRKVSAYIDSPIFNLVADTVLTDAHWNSLITVTGPRTITVPTAVGRKGGKITIKNIGTDLVTIAMTGGQTIDLQAGWLLPNQMNYLGIESDNVNFLVFAQG